jgi:hypothetical protein
MVDVNQVVRETLALARDNASRTSRSSTRCRRPANVFADGHQAAGAVEPQINAEQAMLSANGRGISSCTWHNADQESVISRSTTTGRAFPTICSPRFSIRSSRPRKWAKALGSG